MSESKNLPADSHSVAYASGVRVKHMQLSLSVNFQHQKLNGKAQFWLANPKNETRLFLDSRSLQINSVLSAEESRPLTWQWLDDKPFLGKGLQIELDPDKDSSLIVEYETTAGADALQWLSPEQTFGKKEPFLYTQGQAILSRTWFPCQDSPGIRFTWTADVVVPENLKAVMSADERLENGQNFHFAMHKPVPAYLVALAVGRFDFKPIDDRTGIFAEPEILDRAAWEFADVGKMVSAAEKLYGPYRWGRYDVLILPAAFPFGGMENPCVTFATPTILAGDRSLVSLIAHELAHSWSGNLVTNATWDDFWLNEGFTVYFERRIMEALEGKEYADMLAVLGYQDLLETIHDLGETSEATHLKLHLTGKDPDEGMNDIAYEKGYRLLCELEKLYGRPAWDAFIRQYFDAHAFQSITTEQFLRYLQQNLLEKNPNKHASVNLEAWIYQPGLPKGSDQPISSRFEMAERATEAFIQSSQFPDDPAWSSHEWLLFLRKLSGKASKNQMEELDKKYHFTQSGNSEIRFQWFLLALQTQYTPAYDSLEYFLEHTGRRKFVLPLYKELCKTLAGRDWAKRIFAKARKNYHAVTKQSVEDLLAS